jgi:hypothetical protein
MDRKFLEYKRRRVWHNGETRPKLFKTPMEEKK